MSAVTLYVKVGYDPTSHQGVKIMDLLRNIGPHVLYCLKMGKSGILELGTKGKESAGQKPF